MSRPGRRTALVSAVYLLLFALVQSVLSNAVSQPWQVPDFLLILPFLIGVWYGRSYAVRLGLLAGFLRDFLGGRVLGIGLLIGLYLGLLGGVWPRPERWARLLQSAAGVIIVSFLYSTLAVASSLLFPILVIEPPSFSTGFAYWLKMLPRSLLGLAVATPIVLLVFAILPLKPRPKSTVGGLTTESGVANDVFSLH